MSDEMRPARLWRSLPPDLRVAAATAFWTDEQAALEQAEAVALIARQIKFRPKSVDHAACGKESQASGRHGPGVRSAGGAAAGGLSPPASAPDDGRFLDELGIAHEDGLITEESPDGARRRRRSTRPPRRCAAEFPQDRRRRAISGRCSGRIPKRGAALQGRPELGFASSRSSD